MEVLAIKPTHIRPKNLCDDVPVYVKFNFNSCFLVTCVLLDKRDPPFLLKSTTVPITVAGMTEAR